MRREDKEIDERLASLQEQIDQLYALSKDDEVLSRAGRQAAASVGFEAARDARESQVPYWPRTLARLEVWNSLDEVSLGALLKHYYEKEHGIAVEKVCWEDAPEGKRRAHIMIKEQRDAPRRSVRGSIGTATVRKAHTG